MTLILSRWIFAAALVVSTFSTVGASDHSAALRYRFISSTRILFFLGLPGCLLANGGSTYSIDLCSHCFISRAAWIISSYVLWYMLLVYKCSKKSYGFTFRTFIEAKAWQHGRPMTSHLRHLHDFFSRSTTSTYLAHWTWNSTGTRTWGLRASSISLLRYFSAYRVRHVVMFCVWIWRFW